MDTQLRGPTPHLPKKEKRKNKVLNSRPTFNGSTPSSLSSNSQISLLLSLANNNNFTTTNFLDVKSSY
ncbi:hypothetical protein PRUPE_4G134400 [Prunus persica]|uniref:Uncharacterized protein n=1 Tax=Prunus persica TaxID=3760 RepID=A0A251PK32_PRUPE|nr:hypothetical protein PRUPE_4G134400 [Prunus persica]